MDPPIYTATLSFMNWYQRSKQFAVNLRKTNRRSSSVESTGRSRMKKHSSILSRALEQIPSLIYILMDLNWNLVRKRGRRCAKINCTACGYIACPFKALFIFYHLYCRRERWRRRFLVASRSSRPTRPTRCPLPDASARVTETAVNY